jgi:hypothetical protein
MEPCCAAVVAVMIEQSLRQLLVGFAGQKKTSA